MYGYFLPLVGPRAAHALCAVWFTALIVGAFACSFEPPADFRYGRY